jgi:uncharacterized protein (UPF0276 family)
MLEAPFRAATLPLFEGGLVDALEYSFEIGWATGTLPEWAAALLDHYASEGRLWGHGVTMSPFSVHAPHQAEWLSRVASECRARRYRGVSEHFGFMVAGELDGGAPLPVPAGPATRRVGIDALGRLADSTGTPVGLENLALALCEGDVWDQGPLLCDVLDGVDGGYLVLDLHNLWCQAVTWDVPAEDLLATYPLARARCIHVSGGSWSDPIVGDRVRRFRRDTHDGDVPEPVHALLETAVARCPGLEVVVLERLGATLVGEDAARRLQDDFRRVREIAERAGSEGRRDG